MKKHFDKRWAWIGLGLISLIIRYLSPKEWIESIYSRGLFTWIRRAIDYGIGWFPIPLFYVFYAVLITWLIVKIFKTNRKRFFTWKGLLNGFFSLAAFSGGALFFFFFLWGFNYGRVPLTHQLQLKPMPIGLEDLKSELEKVTAKVLVTRKLLDEIGEEALKESLLPQKLESHCRTAVKATLTQLNYPTKGRVRGRILPTKGILLRFSSSGVYWPFVGEGNIDGGLHPLQQPFTLCHELSHGYGITNEGVCNFLAYLACQQADDPYIKYSGLLSYWRYIAIAYQRFAREEYWAFRATLPKGFQADLDAINKNLDKYPDIFPNLRYFAYDTYLKSQGIVEGMKSYSTIIMLVQAWEEKGKKQEESPLK